MSIVQTIYGFYHSLRQLLSVAEEGDVVSVDFVFLNKKRKVYFIYASGHWRLYKQISAPNFFVILGEKLGRETIVKQHLLFSSSNVKVFSETSRFTYSDLDKKHLLQLARNTGEAFLNSEEPVPVVGKMIGIYSVCVAVWIKGSLRGSMMSQADSLEDTVVKSVKLALTDGRWKPVALEEWKDSQIEITIYSPIRMPVGLLPSKAIDYTKGYIGTFGRKMGLYVPEVFNVTSFKNKQEFFSSLLTQKGGFTQDEIDKAKIVNFDVTDFIESRPGGGDPLSLRASMPEPTSGKTLDLAEVNRVVTSSISWLQKLQETDGNIRPIARTLHRSFGQIDWSRINFTIFALAEWQKVHPGEAISLIDKALEYSEFYLQRQISNKKLIGTSTLYGVVYLAHAYLSLNKKEKAESLIPIVFSGLKDAEFHSILYLEIVTLMRRLGLDKGIGEIEKVCKNNFYIQESKKDTDVASWAEAVVAFEHSDPEFASRVTNWILSHQEEDGSFRQSHVNQFSYTRGTAKIFEVLAINKDKYSRPLAQAHRWLASMQYNETNTYFVEPSFREHVIGGMRHDYNNSDSWIDSAGHYILGASRLYGNN